MKWFREVHIIESKRIWIFGMFSNAVLSFFHSVDCVQDFSLFMHNVPHSQQSSRIILWPIKGPTPTSDVKRTKHKKQVNQKWRSTPSEAYWSRLKYIYTRRIILSAVRKIKLSIHLRNELIMHFGIWNVHFVTLFIILTLVLKQIMRSGILHDHYDPLNVFK